MDVKFHIIIFFTPRIAWCKENSINHPLRQMPVGQQLDFNLVKPSFAVLGFDIHHAQFIDQKFLAVAGSEYFRVGYRRSQIVNQYRVEEMHQQFTVFLRAEQCLEYAIYLGVYAGFHGGFRSPDEA